MDGLSLRPFAPPPPSSFSSSTSVLLPRYNELKPRIFHSTGTIRIVEVPHALSRTFRRFREKNVQVGDLIRGYSRSFRKKKKKNKKKKIIASLCSAIAGISRCKLWPASFPQSCVFKNANVCYVLICYSLRALLGIP